MVRTSSQGQPERPIYITQQCEDGYMFILLITACFNTGLPPLLHANHWCCTILNVNQPFISLSSWWPAFFSFCFSQSSWVASLLSLPWGPSMRGNNRQTNAMKTSPPGQPLSVSLSVSVSVSLSHTHTHAFSLTEWKFQYLNFLKQFSQVLVYIWSAKTNLSITIYT